jgi:hypothetical protein
MAALRELFAQFEIRFPHAEIQRADREVGGLEQRLERLAAKPIQPRMVAPQIGWRANAALIQSAQQIADRWRRVDAALASGQARLTAMMRAGASLAAPVQRMFNALRAGANTVSAAPVQRAFNALRAGANAVSATPVQRVFNALRAGAADASAGLSALRFRFANLNASLAEGRSRAQLLRGAFRGGTAAMRFGILGAVTAVWQLGASLNTARGALQRLVATPLARLRSGLANVFRPQRMAAPESRGAGGGLGSMLVGAGTIYTLQRALGFVTQIHSELESSRAVIAGSLAQFDRVKDFQSGLGEAERLLSLIRADAARLPGEAEEYIEVFRAGLPGVAQAVKGIQDVTNETITEFTNMFTAVGKSARIDAPQMGRDLALMLKVTGQAGAENRSFSTLLPVMQKVSGDFALNAEKFNKMSQQARFSLLNAAIHTNAMQDMVKAMGDSWDATWGAFKANLKLWTRQSTQGLFEGLKKIVSTFNDLSDRLQKIDFAKLADTWIGKVNWWRVAFSTLASVGVMRLVRSFGGVTKALGGVNLLLGTMVKRFLLIAAPVAIFEQLASTLEGNDTALRRWLVSMYGLERANSIITAHQKNWEALKPIIAGVSEDVVGYLGNAAVGLVSMFSAIVGGFTGASKQSIDEQWVTFNAAADSMADIMSDMFAGIRAGWDSLKLAAWSAADEMLNAITDLSTKASKAFHDILGDKGYAILTGRTIEETISRAEDIKATRAGALAREREVRAGQLAYEQSQRDQARANKQAWRNQEMMTQINREIAERRAATRKTEKPHTTAAQLASRVNVHDFSQSTINVHGNPTPSTLGKMEAVTRTARTKANQKAFQAVAAAGGAPW